MPPGYDSWYARLLAQGTAQMPDSFGEGWALLREGWRLTNRGASP